MPKLKVLALIHGGMSSHTVRVTAIAKTLRQTGLYNITFSGDGPNMKIVKNQGFEWIKTELVSREELFSRIDQNLATIYFTRRNYQKYYEIEKNLLDEHRPDIILREHFREMAGVAAKRNNARIFDCFVQKATLSPYYHFDFMPEKLPKWIGLFPNKFLLFAARNIENYYRKKNSFYIRKKLKELGLKKFITIDGVRPDLTLFPDAEELFELADADRRFCKHIGPVVVTGQDKIPDWLEEFKKDKRKKILITKGTTGKYDQTKFFEKNFSDGKYAIAFYTVENKKINDFYGCNKFDINSVLPFCDVLVSHSGTGSNYLAIRHKVPMVLFYDHFEQQINAVELEKKGVACRIGKDNLNKENILKAVEEILNNNSFKQNISILSEKINQYDSLNLAVKYIKEGYENYKKTVPI